MEQGLPAAGKRRSYVLALGRAVPVGGGGDRPVVCGESDQHGLAAIFLAHQLADIHLPASTHRGCPGVAQMRIMRPDNDLGAPTLPTEMRDQRLERLDHMAVAQVPRRHFAEKHRPVIFFGVLDHARILLGVKELLLRDASIALRVLGGTAAQLDELADDLVFAGSVEVAGGDETIDLRVRTEMVEAGITSPGPPCRVRVDLLEILQHGLHRGMEAVEIETVEAGLFEIRGKRVVVPPEPVDEIHHFGVAPHPPREAPEIGERFRGIKILAGAADITVDPVGVGPVRFDRDGSKALLLD